MTALAPPLEIPNDPAMPGMEFDGQPERMLELCRKQLVEMDPDQCRQWRRCELMEAVYQPRRSCRIAYEMRGDSQERATILYARWPADARQHASASRIHTEAGAFDVYRYPRDRRLRHIRAMRRDDWLFEASREWFGRRFGAGCMDRNGWRCTPIKYVPESRLVCRLKGRWHDGFESKWVRAYVRIARHPRLAGMPTLLDALGRATSKQKCAFGVPAAFGVIPERHLLATEFIRGRTLKHAVLERDADAIGDACSRLARIGELTLSTSMAAATDSVASPQIMLRELSAAQAVPADASAALATWSRSRCARRGEAKPVHGDLHGKQVITKNGRLVVVDWDRFGFGDPTRDICNLASEIAFLAAADGDEARGAELTDHAIDSWRRAGGYYDDATAPWWFAYACVARAWGLQRHLRANWRTHSERLLRGAAAKLRNSWDRQW